MIDDKRVVAEYVETWDGGHGYPGYCVVQVIEEVGKPLRLERGRPVYLREHPGMRDWWDVYQRAATNLRAQAAWAPKKRPKAA